MMQRLDYVFPRIASDSAPDCGRGDAELYAKRLKGDIPHGVSDAQFSDDILGQFGLATLCASEDKVRGHRTSSAHTAISAPLLEHIRAIIRSCSKKKMLWPDAWRIVASMENAKIRIKRSICEFIGYSMRQPCSMLPAHGSVAMYHRTGPSPALAISCRSRPKMGNSDRMVLHPESPFVGAMLPAAATVREPQHMPIIARIACVRLGDS